MKPIPSVGILIIKDGKVLLVREEEGSSHLTGMYGIPAGRFEEGESAKDAAVRELEEETGLKCLPQDLVEYPNNVYTATIPRKDGTEKTFAKTVFVCKKYEGEIRPGEDTTPEWVEIEKMGEYKLLPNVEKITHDGMRFT